MLQSVLWPRFRILWLIETLKISSFINLETREINWKFTLWSFKRLSSLFTNLSLLCAIGGKRRRGTTEDEMAGWHHWLDGRESQWTPGVGDGQWGLACCDSWGRKESDTTEWPDLIWSDLSYDIRYFMWCF